MIESEGKPVRAMVRYDYLTNLLEALEDAINSNLLRVMMHFLAWTM